MSPPWFLGIDGGGSRCRARIRNAQGLCLAEAEGGLANVYQDFPGAVKTILATSEAAAGKAGLPLAQLHAGLGLAGVVGPDSARAVAAAGLPFGSVAVTSDGEAACLGAHQGRDGGIVIAGTGSAAFAIVEGVSHALGAMGFALGDDGSGAIIGRFLLRRAVLALDGMAERTELIEAILESFGHDRGRFAAWAQGALSRDYASFAPQVFAAARAGDGHAREAVAEAAAGVDRLARALIRRGAERICLIGSVANALEPWLADDVVRHLVEARADPADGAILLARRALGLADLPA